MITVPSMTATRRRTCKLSTAEAEQRIAVLDKVIASIQLRLMRLQDERKGLKMAVRMRCRHKVDPAFTAALQAAAAVSRKANSEQWRARQSAAKRKLPSMTPEQRRLYKNLRYNGRLPRAEALVEAMRP